MNNRIIELVGPQIRRIRALEEENDQLNRRVRRLMDQKHTEFDRGFAAATVMVEHGADAARLRDAQGTVVTDYDDTQPFVTTFDDEEDTYVEKFA